MKKLTFLFAAISIISCNSKKEEKPHEVEKAAWLLGSWENKTPEGNFTEYWEKANDSVYLGASYFVKGKDTLFHETVELKEEKGVLNYIVSVHEQNAGKPVAFKLTKSAAQDLAFENKAHDYPSLIHYRLVRPDSIVATISGIQQGKPSQDVFTFKKVVVTE